DVAARHLGAAELQREAEALLFRLVAEREVARPAAPPLLPWLERSARLLSRAESFALHALDELDHFLRRRLAHDLQQQRLRMNVGQPTELAHAVRHVREGQGR